MLRASATANAPVRPDPAPNSFAPLDPVSAVAAVLAAPDDQLDYARAKLAFDRIIDPSIDVDALLTMFDRMVETILGLAGDNPSPIAKLSALRKFLYESGPWNEHRPFAYDHGNIRGQNVRVKLISHYVETRLGDCVSMPALFLILADKLGLDMALSLAPSHLFVKQRLEDGRTINLETTGSGLPARDEWLRHVRPMSDRSIESGMYLRRLSRREGVAAMAVGAVQYLRDEGCFAETIAVCELILANNPRDGLVLVNLAIACKRLGMQLIEQYGAEILIPLHLRPRYWSMVARHHTAFAKARALGWEYIG